MALLLTTRPLRGLGLRRPPGWSLAAGALLAVVVLPPLAALTLFVLRQFPGLQALLEEYHPLTRELRALTEEGPAPVGARLHYFLVLAVLPAVSEELAFRGLILTGLCRAFRPWAAVLLSSFLFSLYQMNVFQLLPHFLIGLALGLLVVRSGSVLPAMLFHLVYNTLLIGPGALLPEVFGPACGWDVPPVLQGALFVACTLLAVAGLAAVWRSGRPLPE
jgi:membrane protease YdiL (CAAX protease family)